MILHSALISAGVVIVVLGLCACVEAVRAKYYAATVLCYAIAILFLFGGLLICFEVGF